MKNNFVTVLNGISGATCEMASTFQYAQAPTGIQNPFSSTMCGHINNNNNIAFCPKQVGVG
jgi:hypothetical protein